MRHGAFTLSEASSAASYLDDIILSIFYYLESALLLVNARNFLPSGELILFIIHAYIYSLHKGLDYCLGIPNKGSTPNKVT